MSIFINAMGVKMNKKIFINYESAIKDFLTSVNTWLNGRVPRDSTEVMEISDTKQMWAAVMANPRKYVKYENLYNYVANHANGFFVKHGVRNYDTTMWPAVLDVLSAMGYYYDTEGDFEKSQLADAIKKYKALCSKNALERFKILLTNSEKLIATNQK